MVTNEEDIAYISQRVRYLGLFDPFRKYYQDGAIFVHRRATMLIDTLKATNAGLEQKIKRQDQELAELKAHAQRMRDSLGSQLAGDPDSLLLVRDLCDVYDARYAGKAEMVGMNTEPGKV